MIGWTEIILWVCASGLLFAGFLRRLRSYRSLLWAPCGLARFTSAFPRPGNGLGQYLFGGSGQSARLPTELFGIA